MLNITADIMTQLYFGGKGLLNGLIEKDGKDAEGDLYKFVHPTFVPHIRRASKDLKTILIENAIENSKMKFSDNFDKLTIISTDPETTLLFKRFVHERPPYVTSELLA